MARIGNFIVHCRLFSIFCLLLPSVRLFWCWPVDQSEEPRWSGTWSCSDSFKTPQFKKCRAKVNDWHMLRNCFEGISFLRNIHSFNSAPCYKLHTGLLKTMQDSELNTYTTVESNSFLLWVPSWFASIFVINIEVDEISALIVCFQH